MSAVPLTDEAVVSGIAPPTAAAPRFLRRLLRRPLAIVCLLYLGVLVGIAIVAPLVLPSVMHENAGDLLAVRQAPSWHHLLGTDALGRDVLDRLLVGTAPTLVAVAEGLVVALALGVSLGLAAGYVGGRLDRAVNWFADFSFSMPAIIIVLVVISVFPENTLAAMVTFGILASPGLMRIVRSATLPVRQELYIAAAQVSGLSPTYIIRRHVLPRIAGAVIVQASLLAGGILLVEAGLAFLGLLAPAPAPSWGEMVNEGIQAIVLQPWMIWPPGIVLALTVLAFGLLGDVVRDVSAESWSAPTHRKRALRAVASEPVRELQSAGPSKALLSIAGLTVSFPTPAGALPVVENASFDILAGETVGLVGESGCGKTVTAMSILGLIPGRGQIVSGSIMFDGRDLATLSERELHRVRGKEIGLISQEPMISLHPGFRVGVQIADILRTHLGLSRRQARGRAIDLLERVRLPDPTAVARRYPHELSGGMAQRVAIARALAGEPKLLIADEPTTALDVTVQAEILDLLRDIQAEHEMAALLITHDWGVVADLCDRAVVMYAGQVVERADLQPIFRQPLHPYTEALLASNPHNAPEEELLPTIPGSVPKPGAWPTGCHFHPRCRYVTGACRERPIALERPRADRETRCIHHEQLAVAR
jgi:peptide/nickel transport system permease protein